jgi:hypothetical protein
MGNGTNLGYSEWQKLEKNSVPWPSCCQTPWCWITPHLQKKPMVCFCEAYGVNRTWRCKKKVLSRRLMNEIKSKCAWYPTHQWPAVYDSWNCLLRWNIFVFEYEVLQLNRQTEAAFAYVRCFQAKLKPITSGLFKPMS